MGAGRDDFVDVGHRKFVTRPDRPRGRVLSNLPDALAANGVKELKSLWDRMFDVQLVADVWSDRDDRVPR